jgi:hypothetical protein
MSAPPSVPPIPVTSGSQLSDIVTWVRRIIKNPSPLAITDNLIADYINRFYQYDAPARLQLFELKRQYTFQALPGIFEYQVPFITYFDTVNNVIIPTGIPQYQMLMAPAYCDGVEIGMYYSNRQFFNIYPEFVQNQQHHNANGTQGDYTLHFDGRAILRAFVDDLDNLLPYVYITATDVAGVVHYIVDSGQLNGNGLGILVETDATFQNVIGPLASLGGSGLVDYHLGIATNVRFLNNIPALNPQGLPNYIYTQTSPFSPGTPRTCLFFNNTIKLYPVPGRTHKIQMDAYVTPSQFLNLTDSVPFAYMSEWLARGAARKILSDNGDYEQMQFYEPLFKEQECQVLRRTNRQMTEMRTPTIFSSHNGQQQAFYTQY